MEDSEFRSPIPESLLVSIGLETVFISHSSSLTMSVSAIVNQINAVADGYSINAHGSRDKLLSLCSSLVATLKTPSQTIQRIGWAEESRLAAAAVGF